MTIDIKLNGEPRKVPAQMNVEDLLAHLGIPLDRVAVELNRAIVRKREWTATEVGPGAEVEVVHFVGGGSQ